MQRALRSCGVAAVLVICTASSAKKVSKTARKRPDKTANKRVTKIAAKTVRAIVIAGALATMTGGAHAMTSGDGAIAMIGGAHAMTTGAAGAGARIGRASARWKVAMPCCAPAAAARSKLFRGCGQQGAEFDNWPFDAIGQSVGADETQRNALVA